MDPPDRLPDYQLVQIDYFSQENRKILKQMIKQHKKDQKLGRNFMGRRFMPYYHESGTSRTMSAIFVLASFNENHVVSSGQ
jgi:hypothetical protein